MGLSSDGPILLTYAFGTFGNLFKTGPKNAKYCDIKRLKYYILWRVRDADALKSFGRDPISVQIRLLAPEKRGKIKRFSPVFCDWELIGNRKCAFFGLFCINIRRESLGVYFWELVIFRMIYNS